MIALIALKMDEVLGFGGGFISEPTNYIVAASSLVLGAILWVWTYEQLTRLGEGSPSPTAGRTTRLVRSGIYAHSRNPSLFGKLLGVLSVGFALNSVSFCFILIPVLLSGSLFEKVWRQEPQLIDVFGEEYVKYRNEVPLFIPWKLFIPGYFRS
jgi:protein-S-isoprenylcysteine O-methyltransferase Ste14